MDFEPTQAGPRPGELWRMVRRHRWAIALCTLAGAAAGAAVVSRATPEYRASALILVDDNRDRVARLTEDQASPEQNRIATELEMLRSRALAEAVADSLELRVRVAEPGGTPRGELLSAVRLNADADTATLAFTRHPAGGFEVRDGAGRVVGRAAAGGAVAVPGGELVLAPSAIRHSAFTIAVGTREGAADQVQAGLDISQPARDADVLRVAYRAADPVLARDVPNALAARYTALRREVHGSEARRTVRFLRGQLDTLRAQLTGAEGDLQAFREREGVVDLPVEASTQVTRQAGLEAQRAALEAERSALARSMAQAASAGGAGGSPYRGLTAFPTLLRNETAAGLISSIVQVENDRAELLKRRQPEDPDVAALSRRIDEMEGQLGAIVKTYEQGLANQVSSIDAALGGFSRRMDRIPAREVEQARLTRQTTVLGDMYRLLQTRLKEAEVAEAVDDPGVRVVDAARLPTAPAGTRSPLVAAAFALFGMLAGVGTAFVREYRDRSVHTRDDLQAAAGFPVLGWVPRLGGGLPPGRRALRAVRRALPGRPAEGGRALLAAGGSAPLLPAAPAAGEGPSAAADAYEWVHRNLLFLAPDEEVKTVVVTSPLPGDGKTATAAGLATTLARRGFRVLLVDADLRRGVAGPPPAGAAPGLSDLLAGAASFGQVVQAVRVGDGRELHFLPAGHLPPDPVQLLASPRGQALLEWVREHYALVVIDSPPLNLFADAAVLAGYADATLLVARAAVTPFEAVVHAAEQCRRARVARVGTVLNDIVPERDREYDPAYRWYEYRRAYYAGAA